MEKRNLYIIVAVVLVVGLVLSFSNLTGNVANANPALGQCIDKDAGDDPETPGSVTHEKSEVVYQDECIAEGGVGPRKYLKERYCGGGRIQTTRYLCYGGCGENSMKEGFCLEGGTNKIKE